MFSRTHHFILSHNRWCAAALAFAIVAFILLTVGGQWWAPWRPFFVPTPKEYWGSFMPLAQFAATASLAYLALEIFRHVLHVERIAREVFQSDTVEERSALAERVNGIVLRDIKANQQLLLVSFLFRLIDQRSRWLRLEHPSANRVVTAADSRASPDADGGSTVEAATRTPKELKKEWREAREKARQALVDIRDDAEKENWFWTGSGKAFGRCFLIGRDTVLCVACLTIAAWVHFLATFENVVEMTVLPFFLEWWFQLVIVAILSMAVFLPLYYVFIGRKLVDEMKWLADMGEDQLKRLLNQIPGLERAGVKETLKGLDGTAGKKGKSEPAVPRSSEPRPKA